MKRKNLAALGLCAVLAAGMIGCGNTVSGAETTERVTVTTAGSAGSADAEPEISTAGTDTVTAGSRSASGSNSSDSNSSGSASSGSASSGTEETAAALTAEGSSEEFTDRDLEQTADTSEAKSLTASDGQDIEITEEGVYVISGTASESTIIVNADDTAKVQLVLDGVSITNTDFPAIYVKSADKVFVTLAGENTLSVTGTFTADGETNTDAVIFSKDDLTLNGTGSLTVTSAAGNGITGKDDLKITGGTYTINSAEDAVEANDSIRIADGSFTITSQKDALHAENDEDDSVGYIYIENGSFQINAADDGIQATTTLTVNGGTFDISAAEGLEATCVTINGGTIKITASDDGINASAKSSAVSTGIEINGGDITIDMGSGDTDAVDSNGSLVINGGTLNITAQFAFDYDGSAELNGGTVYVNGEQVTSITSSMMGGGMMGGGMGGFGPKGQMDGQDAFGEQAPEDGQNDFGGQAPADGQNEFGEQGGFGAHGPMGGGFGGGRP